MQESMGLRRSSVLTFTEALALALERCERGEVPQALAVDFPDCRLLPYLELAQRLRQFGVECEVAP